MTKPNPKTTDRLSRALAKERAADDLLAAAAVAYVRDRSDATFAALKLAARKATNATHEVGRAEKNSK